jgi:hypothetical protein
MRTKRKQKNEQNAIEADEQIIEYMEESPICRSIGETSDVDLQEGDTV